jgi:predicted RNA binding protein YcfA (HicA-like mRNA interferase family)
MPRLPDISHAEAVRVFSKLGYRIAREGKHTIMSNGKIRLTIPRYRSITPFTMAAIARDAGLTPEGIKELMLEGWWHEQYLLN